MPLRTLLIKYIGPNLLLVLATYAAIRWELRLLQWLVVGFIWMLLASYMASAANPEARKIFRNRISPDPWLFVVTIDAVILFLLLSAGWYLTAAAYTASTIIMIYMTPRHHLVRWMIDS